MLVKYVTKDLIRNVRRLKFSYIIRWKALYLKKNKMKYFREWNHKIYLWKHTNEKFWKVQNKAFSVISTFRILNYHFLVQHVISFLFVKFVAKNVQGSISRHTEVEILMSVKLVTNAFRGEATEIIMHN